MSSNTVGSRRGSVRGAPPSVYVPFAQYGKEDDLIDAMRPIIRFFRQIGQCLVFLVVIIFLCYVYVLVKWED